MENIAEFEQLTIEGSISAAEIATTTTVTTKKTTTSFKQAAASIIQARPKIPEYNILLLGETGAGKSTTINAFANYLRYSSFEEAASSEFIQLIPSKFTLPDSETGEPQVIQSGSDSNEQYGDDAEDGGSGGNSVTQGPMGYTFPFGGGLIRIIDTPGMGDTRGADTDKKNFDKILGYLHLHKNLHGICILMKSTETRKTTSFKYCINELLTHLHKSACKNIVFCFTFSRNSFFGPGEGFATLKAFLRKELRDVKLEIKTGENCFFIDNEAFRFFVAQKKGYPFLDSQEASYKESWNKSVGQTIKMMEHIMKTEPHDMVHTTSLNNARKMILELAEPMVQLQRNARANIEHIEQREAELSTSNQTKEELAHNLHLEVDDLESRPLSYPSTVCTAAKCTEVVTVIGQSKVNYSQRCHENCRLTEAKTDTVGDPVLKGCAAIAGLSICGQCGCPWQFHMHITCEYIKIKRTIINTSTDQQIKSTEDAIGQIEEALATMRQSVEEYEHELSVIQDVCSKFACILIAHSSTAYNRFIEPYLDLQIEEEKKKIAAIQGYQPTILDSLVKLKETHLESVEIFKKAMDSKSRDNAKLEDIQLYRQQLYELKHSGPQFMQIMKSTQSAQLIKLAFSDKSGINVTVTNQSTGMLSAIKGFLSEKQSK